MVPKPWLPPERKKNFEVLNLSKRVLRDEVINLLSRGMKFVFSYTHTTFFDYNNLMKNIINKEIKMKNIKHEKKLTLKLFRNHFLIKPFSNYFHCNDISISLGTTASDLSKQWFTRQQL
ncbi:hypothetical protein HELRODRAFT_184674 [Helobdella robusta]|uniref:Uncharacterized protein n=1 Tax=Helobdella robusta TaxID=6412 RepID=T1FLQ9_HELRO|nr:hypothetical protein HELRODRAFT_184674 [Helobdella robusta]ESO06752.1 hypothetical protein HELRODRAFT_184674 [Helobdella robusta]